MAIYLMKIWAPGNTEKIWQKHTILTDSKIVHSRILNYFIEYAEATMQKTKQTKKPTNCWVWSVQVGGVDWCIFFPLLHWMTLFMFVRVGLLVLLWCSFIYRDCWLVQYCALFLCSVSKEPDFLVLWVVFWSGLLQ